MPRPLYVSTGDAALFEVNYFDRNEPAKRKALEDQWSRFNRTDPSTGKTFNIWYRPSNWNLEVTANYSMPPTAQAGRYRIETYIPGRNATTHKAIFTVTHNVRMENGQVKFDEPVTASVDMYNLFDVWVPIGEFDLDPASNPLSGRVREYDITREEPPAKISFGPVRWVPLFQLAGEDTGRFDAPVGSQSERDGEFGVFGNFVNKYPKWTPQWYDVNPFLSWYFLGYHTGSDLNITTGASNDRGAPIYAIGDGTVSHVGHHSGWGNIIVVEHGDAKVTMPDGSMEVRPVFSRYGHTDDNILVHKGQQVHRGDVLGFIGLAEGVTSGWHLHFDISHTDLLRSKPWHWPDLSKWRQLKAQGASERSKEYKQCLADMKAEVVANYINPYTFMMDNHG